VGLRRYKENGRGFFFSRALVDWLGPRRQDDEADEPYVHYAAAVQALFEEHVLGLVDAHLAEVIAATGKVVFAGGGALNVKLNQRLLARSDVTELFVQPAAGDSGTALGAATYVAQARSESVAPLKHVYLGPCFDDAACKAAIDKAGPQITARKLDDPVDTAAQLLTDGEPVAWFQGRMEFGPRALGGRSILGCPNTPGIADKINQQIKFRERWRPFCPSLLDSLAREVLQTEHPAPYMTITFDVAPGWRQRIPEVVHEDGTARAHVVTEAANPRYYKLLKAMERMTGNGVLLNTSLNRRGEPMVCAPEDAIAMFLGSDLQYLIMQDWLVTKRYGAAS